MRYRLFFSVATLGPICAAWASHFVLRKNLLCRAISAESSELFEKQKGVTQLSDSWQFGQQTVQDWARWARGNPAQTPISHPSA